MKSPSNLALSWVMEAAAFMGIAFANGGGKPPDWQDSMGIVALLLMNSTLSFDRESNVSKSAACLARHASTARVLRVLRDGEWTEEYDSLLVPGDIISIKTGDTILADAHLLVGDPLIVNQFALTGLSLPVTKGPGDCIYSGSTCKQGEIEAVIIATGVCTSFRKASHIVDSSKQVRPCQRILKATGNFCICFVAVVMII